MILNLFVDRNRVVLGIELVRHGRGGENLLKFNVDIFEGPQR